MTEVVETLGRTSRRGVLGAVVLATLLGTAGCSSVPDAINPVEWYRGTRDWIAGDDKVEPAKPTQAKPVPGADKPYPELTSVPGRPAGTVAAERRQMARTLTADRDAARYTDEQIRRQTDDVTASQLSAPAPAASIPAPRNVARSAPRESNGDQPARHEAPAQREPSVRSQRLPEEVRSAEPAAGQVAAVPRNPPPPPHISPVIAAGQPIPVDPMPPPPVGSVPAAPPAAVEAPPAEQRTAFVRPNRFSTRFPKGAGTIQGPRTSAALPPAATPNVAQGGPPGFGPAPGQGFSTAPAPVATIYFGSGSTKLGVRDRDAIRKAFQAWQSHGGRIRVVGHASSRTRNMDRVSHELANFRISDERARAVAEELVRLGVDPTAIIVEAVSDQQPAFVEAMPAGEAGNRRAEILLEN